MDEPVADNVRGILDGHIILDRGLAQKYHYPAIDVLSSVSRLSTVVAQKDEQQAAGRMRRLLAEYRSAEDLISVGAYASGSNPVIDEAIDKMEYINGFLRQEIDEQAHIVQTLNLASAITEMNIDTSVYESKAEQNAEEGAALSEKV